MEFVMPTTGAKLIVSEASYGDVEELMTALGEAGVGIPLARDVLSMDVTFLKDMLLKTYISQRVKDALFKCSARAIYENAPVTRALFDDAKLRDKARRDYFMILWHVVETNCAPFLEPIFSALKERLQKSPSSQKSPFEPEPATSSR